MVMKPEAKNGKGIQYTRTPCGMKKTKSTILHSE